MHERLIDYISSQVSQPLTSDEIEVLRQYFIPKKLRRHQFFLQEGDVSKAAGFVAKGALKQYSVDENGKENVLALYLENWWAGDRESFMQGTPSPFFIEAVEESTLLVITKDAYPQVLERLRFLPDLLRTLSEKQSLQLLKRVHASHTMTAEQRLAALEKQYPAFLQRFPQHTIASYLGMTKETLSRIRSGSARK